MTDTAARPLVVAYVADLMFLSRIREAAQALSVELRAARKPEQLLAACREAPRVVLVELDSPRLPALEGVRALRADPALAAIPVIGFLGHVHADLAREAEASGCTRVMPRGAFVQQLPELLGNG